MMNSDSILVTNIQRFSLHDGPGIRTTVFLKGCSLKCPWCSNPENISPLIQPYVSKGVKGEYGKYYSTDELFQEIVKDAPYFTGCLTDYHHIKAEQLKLLPGGVTFSGGECLLQICILEDLLKRIKKRNIHIVFETSLYASHEKIELALRYVDLFYIDIKILEANVCRRVMGGNLNLFLRNLEIVLRSRIPSVIRVPVIGGYTDTEDNKKNVKELIAAYCKDMETNILRIELLKEHNLAINKYNSLIAGGNDAVKPKYIGVTDDFMEQYKNELMSEIGLQIPIDILRV